MRLKNFFQSHFQLHPKIIALPLCLSREINLKKKYATEYRSTQSHLSIAKVFIPEVLRVPLIPLIDQIHHAPNILKVYSIISWKGSLISKVQRYKKSRSIEHVFP